MLLSTGSVLLGTDIAFVGRAVVKSAGYHCFSSLIFAAHDRTLQGGTCNVIIALVPMQ